MKKIIIAILVVLILLTIILLIFNDRINLKQSELKLLNEVSVDLTKSKIFEELDINKNTLFTWFFQEKGTNVESIRNRYLDEYDIELPEFNSDFENHYIVVSFGRKIKEIQYYNPYFKKSGFTRAHITFDDIYKEGGIYIYQMDKVLIEDGLLDNNYYYIMNKGKKQFVGRNLFDLNKINLNT